jgi:hypothetical protein
VGDSSDMSELQTFRHYQISQDAQGAAVEVWRSGHEVACLVWDSVRGAFGELHVSIVAAERQMEPRAFQALVKAAAGLRHPHILTVHEGGEDDGANFCVTDLLDGERFDSWLRRCPPLPPWLALQCLAQIASALCVASPHLELLAGVNLMHCGITMGGEDPGRLSVRVADWGLTGPRGAVVETRRVEARVIGECGRLLLRMLTGEEAGAGPHEVTGEEVAPELAFLINTLLQPKSAHHPRNMEQLHTLVERCRHGLTPELARRPARLGAEYYPRLPLAGEFAGSGVVAGVLEDEFVVEARSFDAAGPYTLRATQRARRDAARVQLLPPGRLLDFEFSESVVHAMQSVKAGVHRHLLRVLCWHATEPRCVVEESSGRWNLEEVVRVRGGLTPPEIALVLGQLEAAAKEADAVGMVAQVRNPREIGVVFGAVPPADERLAETVLGEWPAFVLKVRTWPVALQLTQPEQFRVETLVGDGGGGEAWGRAVAWDAVPTARDFALLATWMSGGPGAVPEELRTLVQEAVRVRQDGGAARRGAFVSGYAARAKTLTAAKVAEPAAAVAGGSGKGEKRRKKGRGGVAAGGVQPLDLELDDETDEPTPTLPGFAEALFGVPPGEGVEEVEAAGSAGVAWGADAVEDEGEDGGREEATVFGGRHHAAPMDFDVVDPDDGGVVPRYETGLPGDDGDEAEAANTRHQVSIAVIVIVFAAVIAALAAHVTGTGFWLR